jgi:hypothetical protein
MVLLSTQNVNDNLHSEPIPALYVSLRNIFAPLVTNDGLFNCPTMNFVKPGANAARSESGSQSARVSPSQGAYPGIGIIKPDSGPS